VSLVVVPSFSDTPFVAGTALNEQDCPGVDFEGASNAFDGAARADVSAEVAGTALKLVIGRDIRAPAEAVVAADGGNVDCSGLPAETADVKFPPK